MLRFPEHVVSMIYLQKLSGLYQTEERSKQNTSLL